MRLLLDAFSIVAVVAGAFFYLAGTVGPKLGVNTHEIWWSAIPFIGLQILGLALCMAFPDIILWLPRLLY